MRLRGDAGLKILINLNCLSNFSFFFINLSRGMSSYQAGSSRLNNISTIEPPGKTDYAFLAKDWTILDANPGKFHKGKRMGKGKRKTAAAATTEEVAALNRWFETASSLFGY
jgi:hypothetical protein